MLIRVLQSVGRVQGTKCMGVLGRYTVAAGKFLRGGVLALSSSAFIFSKSRVQNTCS